MNIEVPVQSICLMAATAELHDLTLLHRDNDFECVAAVTGQPLVRMGSKRES